MDGAEDTTGLRKSAAADVPIGFERNLGPTIIGHREGRKPHRRLTFVWREEIAWPLVEVIMSETKEWL